MSRGLGDVYKRQSLMFYNVNDIVEHQRFGLGLVEKIEGDIQNKKATINFKIGGRKTILLKFAKLKIKKGT